MSNLLARPVRNAKSMLFVLTASTFSLLTMASPAPAADAPPAWAYPVNPPDFKPAPDDGVPRRVAGSTASYTVTQLRDRFIAPVWHPGEHPPLPEIVAQGRKPDVFACGFCHRADGPGGPENANLAGQPAAYIVQQMNDFKNGLRKTSVAKRNVDLMIALTKPMTDDEIATAAAYFSALKPRAVIKVVESDTVPKTFIMSNHLADAKSGEREPIGTRIIEVPEVLDSFVNRDTHAKFIAYVPPGSVARGEALVKTGGAGKTVQCAVCHGPDLKGVGRIPAIAGRSPSYMARQLYDLKSGARAGASSVLMREVVARLGDDDMVAITAYLASLAP
ncbi:MAG: cyc4 [Betaproteobacteria bacterium]|nr:cyc4 [Betaproteobacteria bacterium]